MVWQWPVDGASGESSVSPTPVPLFIGGQSCLSEIFTSQLALHSSASDKSEFVSVGYQIMATSSTLNPNAPIFVPLAYREVEDFSDQWWDLVRSSPWFRDYWLQECFQDPQTDPDSAFFDIDSFFQDDQDITLTQNMNTNKQEGIGMDLVSLGLLKWRKPRGIAEMAKRCREKAPKIVNVKLVHPRPIKQPR